MLAHTSFLHRKQTTPNVVSDTQLTRRIEKAFLITAESCANIVVSVNYALLSLCWETNFIHCLSLTKRLLSWFPWLNLLLLIHESRVFFFLVFDQMKCVDSMNRMRTTLNISERQGNLSLDLLSRWLFFSSFDDDLFSTHTLVSHFRLTI